MDTKLNMQELDQVAGGSVSCYDNNTEYSTGRLSHGGDRITFAKKCYPSGERLCYAPTLQMIKMAIKNGSPDTYSSDEIAGLMNKLTDTDTQYQLTGREREMFLKAAKSFLG